MENHNIIHKAACMRAGDALLRAVTGQKYVRDMDALLKVIGQIAPITTAAHMKRVDLWHDAIPVAFFRHIPANRREPSADPMLALTADGRCVFSYLDGRKPVQMYAALLPSSFAVIHATIRRSGWIAQSKDAALVESVFAQAQRRLMPVTPAFVSPAQLWRTMMILTFGVKSADALTTAEQSLRTVSHISIAAGWAAKRNVA